MNTKGDRRRLNDIGDLRENGNALYLRALELMTRFAPQIFACQTGATINFARARNRCNASSAQHIGVCFTGLN